MADMMEKVFNVKITGEPRDIERVMRGSEEGYWKSAYFF